MCVCVCVCVCVPDLVTIQNSNSAVHTVYNGNAVGHTQRTLLGVTHSISIIEEEVDLGLLMKFFEHFRFLLCSSMHLTNKLLASRQRQIANFRHQTVKVEVCLFF